MRPLPRLGRLPSLILFGLLSATPLAAQQADASARSHRSGLSAELVTAADLNPDPHVLEVRIEAREAEVEFGPGRRVRAWTYDGRLPGPLLRASLGDRLIVHLENQLGTSTTIYWHGLRVPNAMDGVPDHTQPQVPPGGTFTYDFVLRDAGLFWYHPHLLSAAQVGFGLYGVLLVDDPREAVRADEERVFVLSDLAVAEGELEHPDSGGQLGMAFGREGNDVLVNGRTDAAMTVREGTVERWRIVNAAKSRYFLLDLEGIVFTRIGVDGGLQERPTDHDAIVITPGERVDVLVMLRRPEGADRLVLRSGLHNRGFGSVEFRQVEQLLSINFNNLPPLPAVRPMLPWHAIEPVDTSAAVQVAIDMTLQTLENGAVRYAVNGRPFGDGMDITARVGETQVWTLTNRTKWSHPFHLHGFFFQVLGADGRPVRPLAWKDTVDVPFEQTVRIAVRFDERPGMWMYHCHILDHADGGLMGMVHLLEPATAK